MSRIAIVDHAKVTDAHPFTPELAARMVIEMRKLNRPGERGFRIRCIADQIGDTRLIQAAGQYADDHSLGVIGVRGEGRAETGYIDFVSDPDGYSTSRIAALTRYREANAALGLSARLVYMAAIDCLSAVAIGRQLGISDKTAAARVHAALNLLADHYERPRKSQQ
jgi:hypothetical protein